MGRNQIRLTVASLIACAGLLVYMPCGSAQETMALPEAPQTTGQITGIVTDLDGDWIVGARIAVAGATLQTVVSDAHGGFVLAAAPAGDLRLTISAQGFATVVETVTLRPGQQLEVATIQLTAALDTDVQVTISPHDVAQIEMHEEEKQRLLGVLPNFFVTYDWHAPALSTKQKFELAWKSTVDPTSFLAAGAVAGIQQWQNDFKGYGQGAQGYGKRYGAAFADGAIGNMLGGAVFPTLFHQDPRYFYMGKGTIRHRALYAVAAAVIARGDNGKWQPNYSSVLGDFSAGAISNIYYPSTDRNGAGLTIENGFLGVVGDAVNNVIEEFVFRHITTNTHHQPPTVSVP